MEALKVVIRVRPEESSAPIAARVRHSSVPSPNLAKSCVEASEKRVCIHKPATSSPRDVNTEEDTQQPFFGEQEQAVKTQHNFSFDRVFGPSSSQAVVFADVEPLLDEALQVPFLYFAHVGGP